MANQKVKLKNELVGVVVSDKMDKTIRVEVAYRVRHGRYGKFIRNSVVCRAHDEKNEAKEGDRVKIFECRPISKTKRWMLAEVVEKQNKPKEVEL